MVMKTDSQETNGQVSRPAMSPEARENQLISAAVDLAERQLREGTASSQVITHYLKLGSEREKLEREKLRYESNLLKSKSDAIKQSQETSAMYQKAIDAMRRYGGNGDSSSDDVDYDDDYDDYDERY